MKKRKTGITILIEVGSSAARLMIAQYIQTKGRSTPLNWEILETAEQPVSLGRDVFHSRKISVKTITSVIETLRGFQEIYTPYQSDSIMAVGSTAIRESSNKDSFLDRVLLYTGLDIRVLSGAEITQFTYMAAYSRLFPLYPRIKRCNSLILEVGGGSTDILLMNRGRLTQAMDLPVGGIRFLEKAGDTVETSRYNIIDFIKNFTKKSIFSGESVALKNVSVVIALGSEIRLAAEHLGVTDESGFARILTIKKLNKFIDSIKKKSQDELVSSLSISFSEAEWLLPNLLINSLFLNETGVDEILVPSFSIRDGMLVEQAMEPGFYQKMIREQIISASKNLAKHYKADKRHYEYVKKTSTLIYDELWKNLGLQAQHRQLLEVAAILHDIGAFISERGHHKHGMYMIANSEIFGLKELEKAIVEQVVRYHRKSKPTSSHASYMALPRRNRIVVSKLAAILRVADALDRAHNQRISIEKIEIKKNKVSIFTDYPGDLSLERISLRDKSDLFQDIFGMSVSLQRTGRKDERE